MSLKQWWRRDKTRFRSTSTLADPNLNNNPNPNLNLNPNPNLNPNLNLSPSPNLNTNPNLNPNPNPNLKPNPFVVISAWQQNERLWVMHFVYYNIWLPWSTKVESTPIGKTIIFDGKLWSCKRANLDARVWKGRRFENILKLDRDLR